MHKYSRSCNSFLLLIDHVNLIYICSYNIENILFRKELFKKLNTFVHLNLCIALSCGLLIFMAGIEGGKQTEVWKGFIYM